MFGFTPAASGGTDPALAGKGATVEAAVATKASQGDVDTLTTALGSKASQASVTAAVGRIAALEARPTTWGSTTTFGG